MIFSLKKLSLFIAIFAVISCGRDSKTVDAASQQKTDTESNTTPLPSAVDPTELPTDLTLHDEGIEFSGLSVEEILLKKYSKAKLKCDYGSIMENKVFDTHGNYAFSNTSNSGTSNSWRWDLLKDFNNRPQWTNSSNHYVGGSSWLANCGKLDHQVKVKSVGFEKISKETTQANGELGHVDELRPFVLLDYAVNYIHSDKLPINPQPYLDAINSFQVDEGPLGNTSTSQPFEVGKNIFIHLHQIQCRLVTTLKPERE
jgi:hypothetical protein